MKKNFFIAAVAALALASCSNDEVVQSAQTSPDNAISFRPLMNNVTRAANGTGLKSAWETGDILYVTAMRGEAKYFQDQFVKDGTGFNSANKHYWPSDIGTNNITFTAFWGAAYKTWAADGDQYKLASTYTVPDAVAEQKDLLFAMKTETSRPTDGGTVLNFRHMLSQICVKVANDQPNLKITLSGVRVGYLNKAGDFTYSGATTSVTNTQVTDATNSANAVLIPKENWAKTDNASKNASYLFEQTVSMTLNGETAAAVPTSYSPWILMPQALSAATAYTEARTTAGPVNDSYKDLNGAYIALKLAFVDKDTNVPIVAEQWCYWPIGTTWNPGYRYTYTVNAGSGGYQPTDQDNNTDLDPVLDNLVIWFQPTCTIDTWVDENYGISAPIARTANYAFSNGTTQTINLGAGANGTYDITITGLTEGHSVTAAATNNFTAAPTVSNSGTVPANGTLTITGTLSANGTAEVTSAITITDTTADPAQVMTINIVQAAPTAP